VIRIRGVTSAQQARVYELKAEIEAIRQRPLFCLCQKADDPVDSIDSAMGGALREFAKAELAQLGKVPKLSVLIESPGGDADDTFRLAKLFRRHTDDLEVLVVFWCKSAATLFCLAADKIYMGSGGELGPLDVQLVNPKDGTIFSGLQSFKSLEYLREYAMETLHNVATLFENHTRMDYIHAVKVARPIVSDIVTSLFRQVDPNQLGEARRLLAVGEEYGKRLMARYAYKHLDSRTIARIVRDLVWEYPNHGFAVDFREAQQLGLNIERLDDLTATKCEELVNLVSGCVGTIIPAASGAIAAPQAQAVSSISLVSAPAVDATTFPIVQTGGANEGQQGAGNAEISA
jgi:hypothetical protein